MVLTKIVIKLNTENYKGTALLSNTHKILSNMLLCRQTPYVDKISGYHHCSLQCDIVLMIEYCACMTHKKMVTQLFLDFKKAYALRGKFVYTILTELLYQLNELIKI
jgi:hypothetical protein